ncbi:MAG: hypothetical protein HQ510_01830 [Candidatus Marinimicrobia bacterium]|nr:hypothetical protein [Candidatus Neomarinimicrobiota bacterium]
MTKMRHINKVSTLPIIYTLIGLFLFGSACTVKRDWNNPFDPEKSIHPGCVDPNAINFDPDANIDDGSCEYVWGCTDEFAANYDPNAFYDDGSCICESYLVSDGNSYCQSDLDVLQNIIDISDLGEDYWWGVYSEYLSLPLVDSTIAFILFQAQYGGSPEDKMITPLILGSQLWENSRLVEWDCISCSLKGVIPDSFQHLVELKKLLISDNNINYLSWDICDVILNLDEFDISGNEICEEDSYPECVGPFIIDQNCE